MSSINIQTPAKINLYLKVLDKRADGYHEIESLMLPISLYDELVLETIPEGIELWCDHPKLQLAEDNLVYKAAQAMQGMASSPQGVKIKLYKNIPLAAGLGGGSSDAAAVLLGLNRLWNLNLCQEQLIKLGAQLGADVPFFIVGRPAIARGIGELLEPVSFKPLWLVLINPGFRVSAAEAYAGLPPLNLGLTKKESYTTISKNLSKKLNTTQIKSLLVNDLEAPVINKYPVISDINERLLVKGALGALMSGSGPSVFGLFDSRKEAEDAYRELQAEAGVGWSVFLIHTLD